MRLQTRFQYTKCFNQIDRKLETNLGSRGYSEAVLMDLLIAFDTINQELLIAKLHAYSFNKESLELILDYLSKRWQRPKICDNFSSWAEVLNCVP